MSFREFLSENVKNGYLNYYYSEPGNCQIGEKLPLVIYIHGAGCRGNDVSMMLTNTALKKAVEKVGDKCIIVAPQCHSEFWFELYGELCEFIDFIRNEPNVDSKRVYITGASMGGYTTWQLCLSHPDWFAAAAPICGGGMYWAANRLRNLPIWAFHGALDGTVLCEESIKMVRAINRAGGSAKLTVFPSAEHNAWVPALSMDELWDWMLSQKSV